MMTRLSTKGQVTIPQAIREQLGIGPGSALDIRLENGRAVLLVVDDGQGRTPGQRALSALRSAPVKPCMSTEELMALTRGWGEPDEDHSHGIAP